jgi:predicted TIM-barrel fold metal-dependent hydrolase
MFDCSLHPTLDGTWDNERPGLTFEAAREYLEAHAADGGFLIGVDGVGQYNHQEFWNQASRISNACPVASLTTGSPSEVEAQIREIALIGFRFVKVYPRLLAPASHEAVLQRVLSCARDMNLKVLYCTVYPTSPDSFPNEDPLWVLSRCLRQFPDVPVMLMHGGGHRLLAYAEHFRYFPNVYLDLSFTLTRYWSASVKSDINYLTKYFDQRICLGSDLPDVLKTEWLNRLHDLRELCDEDTWKRISADNALCFVYSS